MGSIDDERLVSSARAGDRAALDALLRGHHDRLRVVCRRIVGNDTDAADALQETLISIVRGLGRFDRRSRFSTWSYRIAVNASLDQLRARARRPVAELVERSVDPTEPSATRLDVDAALRCLGPEQRAAVVLRDLCGLDYAEIADVLGLPAGTVRSRIARGRAALVPLLADPGAVVS